MNRTQTVASLSALAAIGIAALVFGPVSGRSIAPPVPDPGPAGAPGEFAAEPSLPSEPSGEPWDAIDRHLEEGSYARALELLRAIDPETLSTNDARWLRFRIADATWRNLTSTRQPEDTGLAAALDELRGMSRPDAPANERDRIWIEARESLGDHAWMRRGGNDWSAAWNDYRAALDGWAASRDLDLARERYLEIVRKAARIVTPPWWRAEGWRPDLPVDVLEGARSIAVARDDVRMTAYLYATALARDVGNAARFDRAERALVDAVETCRGGRWHDDALWGLIQLRISPGRPVRTDDASVEYRPDWAGAVEALRTFVETFPEGTSRYGESARRTLDDIVSPRIDVGVAGAFLPDSEIEYVLTWRNVASIDLALTPVDVVDDARSPTGEDRDRDPVNLLEAGDREPARRWTHATNDDGAHRPGRAVLRFDESPGTGAWLLTARAEGLEARALILVTRTAVIVHGDRDGAAVYVGDALDGTPRKGAEVAVFEAIRHRRDLRWTASRTRTDADGLVRVRFTNPSESRQVMIAASHDGGPAIATTYAPGRSRSPGNGSWRILAFPDRPAYRPGETVAFKAIARTVDGEGRRTTPDGVDVTWSVRDPRGTEVARGRGTFNPFGGLEGSLDLAADAALGTYHVRFHPPGSDGTHATAPLFVVEEYRLPEFRVDVRPPTDDDGAPRSFRPGETVEVEIEASYYDGAPVAGGSATVVVRQHPLWIRPIEAPRFAWLTTSDRSRQLPYTGGGSVVETTSVTLDEDGRATITVSPPAGVDHDRVYGVEARVTDAARREIVGTGEVRVTRQRYFAFARVERRVVRPGDTVEARFRTVTAGERPIEAEGTVRVTRRVWDEVWFDPWGREVRGEDLARAKARTDRFPPPPPEPGGPSWRLKFRGYREQPVLERTVRTGHDGEGAMSFTAERAGWYRIAWESEPEDLWPVTAETSVWVTDADTASIGYRPGGVEIIVDRDAFRVGEEAAVFLTVENPGTPILFTIEPDGLASTRLVRTDGDGTLLRVPMEARHAPNLFLHAAAMFDARLTSATEEVAVAPAGQTFEVAVDLGEGIHAPGSEFEARLTATGPDGEPVDAEIALAVRDEAVEAIASDFAGDPRTAFLTDRRGSTVRTASSFDRTRYLRLLPKTSEDVAEPTDRIDDEEHARLASLGYVAESEVAAPPGAARQEAAKSAFAESDAFADSDAAGGLADVVVRTDFRATALWAPAVRTGVDGTAKVSLRWPESLTAWHAVARGAGTGDRYGYGEATTRTSKPLTVRLQTPRFLVAGDATTISAVVTNNGETPLRVETVLESDGVATDRSVPRRMLDVPPGRTARADWRVRAIDAGSASFTVRAAAEGGSNGSDGMTRAIPIVEHGIERFLARSGKVRGGAVSVLLDLPAERRDGSTRLDVRVTPSLAITALDALPYLIDYPYGCTEQTLSRFLPAVIVRRTLVELGLDAREVEGRMFGGIEPQHADAVQGDRDPSLGKLDGVVREGVTRLADFQHADGGWGWWKEGSSDPFMTAYALWGLSEAAGADVDVDRRSLRRAADWLDKRLVRFEGRPDLQAWMLHALAAQANLEGRPMTELERTAFEAAYADRERSAAYGKALLAVAADRFGRDDEARVLVRNLENGVIRDDDPDRSILVEDAPGGGGRVSTAHWGADPIGFRWSEGKVESTAFALRALLAIDPDHPLIEPATTWLVENRRGAQWRHTRETAIAVLALTDVLATTNVLEANLAWAVEINGTRVGEGRVTPDTVLAAPDRFEIDPARLRDGENRVRIVRLDGTGPIHFAVGATYFSLEEPIPPAGNRLFVRREYVARTPYETLLAGTRYDRATLADGETATSGDRIEAVLTVEAKNDLEYLVFEDAKPAGFEAVDVRSGGGVVARRLRDAAASVPAVERDSDAYTGEEVRVYREFRDRNVVTFLDRLPEGFWELRYELRAETPGRFHGLPTVGHAMYVPEIRGNGSEHRVSVDDRED